MAMTPSVRKLALTAHVTSSVGWLGAVGGFLALAIAGLVHQDADTTRAAYIAMDLTAWLVIVPLSLASLPTGLVMSLGTEWGLFRHYWVVAKFVITIVATAILLVHLQPIGHMADVVRATTLARGELAGLRIQLVADAGAALVALLLATLLSDYKPRGMTAYGRKWQYELRNDTLQPRAALSSSRPKRAIGLGLVLLLALFVIVHLMNGGMGGH